jgi:hypothetical protein
MAKLSERRHLRLPLKVKAQRADERLERLHKCPSYPVNQEEGIASIAMFSVGIITADIYLVI